MKKFIAIVAMAVMGITDIIAQSTDKNLLGAWIMESMQFDGEEEILCNKESGYVQFKYYGKDGEYACAQIIRQKDGQIVVAPHEYGTYSYKDGVYTEMGRPASDEATVVLVDKNTFKGRFFNRHDVWKKADMPQELVDYIVNYCKIVKQGPSAEMQQLIEKSIFAR